MNAEYTTVILIDKESNRTIKIPLESVYKWSNGCKDLSRIIVTLNKMDEYDFVRLE